MSRLLSFLPGQVALFITAAPLLACTATCAAAADDRAASEFFEKRIRPVLVEKCYQCHSAKSPKVKGGLVVDSRDGLRRGGESGPAVVPGNTKDSLLLQALRYQDLRMPPNEKLPDAVIADFERWIAGGAVDPRGGQAVVAGPSIDVDAGRKFWSFQPLRQTAPPVTGDKVWPRSDIDRFILAELEQKKLQPVADADRASLLRRLTFDLTGLPPTAAEIDAFSMDQSANALENVVDRLLASPRFGERWGRHWLDVARYGESSGRGHNVVYPLAWRYRDYVIDAFNADRPYDQFVREQLAGDLLPASTDMQRNQQIIATGFLVVGTKDLRERDRHRYMMDFVDEQIDVTGRAFLGLTLACARCHDHKFDPIRTEDYYGLAGIFCSSEPLIGATRVRHTDPYGAELYPLAGQRSPITHAERAEMLKLALQITRLNLDLRDEKRRILLALGKTRVSEAQQEALTKDEPTVVALAEKRAELKPKLAALQEKFADSLAGSAMAMREATATDCAVHIRGEASRLGEVVPRGFPSALVHGTPPAIAPQHSGRLELANWIARHPLTARVMVNRIWHHLFGVGLVESVDDFGKTGQPPSHPELLDHLAQRFIDQGWSVKKLIREIMLSHVYQLSSDHQQAAYEADSGNRLLWRMSRRRLDANAIRDAVLFVSGDLKLERPAHPVTVKFGDERLTQQDINDWSAVVIRHRSVYLPIMRDFVPDDLSIFDFPEPELVVGRRDVTTVPTQALFMMNSEFIVEQSRKTALRLLAEKASDDERVERVYRLILGRTPDAAERKLMIDFLNDHGAEERTLAWSTLCQTLLAAAEFRYVY